MVSNAWLVCKVNRDINEIPLDSVMIGTTEIIGVAFTEAEADTFRAQNHPAIHVKVPLLALPRVYLPNLEEGELVFDMGTGQHQIATRDPFKGPDPEPVVAANLRESEPPPAPEPAPPPAPPVAEEVVMDAATKLSAVSAPVKKGPPKVTWEKGMPVVILEKGK